IAARRSARGSGAMFRPPPPPACTLSRLACPIARTRVGGRAYSRSVVALPSCYGAPGLMSRRPSGPARDAPRALEAERQRQIPPSVVPLERQARRFEARFGL